MYLYLLTNCLITPRMDRLEEPADTIRHNFLYHIKMGKVPRRYAYLLRIQVCGKYALFFPGGYRTYVIGIGCVIELASHLNTENLISDDTAIPHLQGVILISFCQIARRVKWVGLASVFYKSFYGAACPPHSGLGCRDRPGPSHDIGDSFGKLFNARLYPQPVILKFSSGWPCPSRRSRASDDEITSPDTQAQDPLEDHVMRFHNENGS
ncbi:hypothetical protein F4819DRAFT_4000 [Hypoxylon fuscum]|nr:hypothetical protein F4819DRAFT_4000 [Hypoxylon fuscum]